MQSEQGIRFDDVSFDRADRRVLSGITAHLTEHRVGLIGRNGSGKSTIMRLAGALDYVSEGAVTVEGIDPRDDLKAVRPLVGYLFQNKSRITQKTELLIFITPKIVTDRSAAR